MTRQRSTIRNVVIAAVVAITTNFLTVPSAHAVRIVKDPWVIAQAVVIAKYTLTAAEILEIVQSLASKRLSIEEVLLIELEDNLDLIVDDFLPPQMADILSKTCDIVNRLPPIFKREVIRPLRDFWFCQYLDAEIARYALYERDEFDRRQPDSTRAVYLDDMQVLVNAASASAKLDYEAGDEMIRQIRKIEAEAQALPEDEETLQGLREALDALMLMQTRQASIQRMQLNQLTLITQMFAHMLRAQVFGRANSQRFTNTELEPYNFKKGG